MMHLLECVPVFKQHVTVLGKRPGHLFSLRGALVMLLSSFTSLSFTVNLSKSLALRNVFYLNDYEVMFLGN